MQGREKGDRWAVDAGGEFQRFCEQVADALALDGRSVPGIGAFLSSVRRLPLVWFQFSPVARTRDTFARCTTPWAGDMLFAQLPASGEGAEREDGVRALHQLSEALRTSAGRYLCVVEGALPVGVPGLGRVLQTALQVCSSSRAVLCVGAAGAAGALAAAAPSLVDALGAPAVHVAGAPPTAVAFAAALVTKLVGGVAADALEAAEVPEALLPAARP